MNLSVLLAWFDGSTGREAAGERLDWLRAGPFLAIHALCGLAWYTGVSPTAIAVAVGLYLVRMFAITAFYHRYFSHRAFKTSRAFQFLMALLGNSAVQRGPIWWAAHHRHHHRHSDRPEDLHSPVQYGFWQSHVRWFLTGRGFATQSQYVTDLLAYPELRWLDRFDWVGPVALLAALAASGAALQTWAPDLGTSAAQLVVWGFAISTVATWHVTYTINSLSHQWGTRRYQTNDDSRNNWLLALLTLGEGWHNNHHHHQSSARQGFFWWEIDLAYYGLRLLAALRLVWDLRPVPAHVLLKNRSEVPAA
ncbi:MAG: acyl-CoA desaturase [Candidatus Sericytochromatia bacterium]|nr:acyl-CoA desaturase [Candidatus Sericytochromatia bacterium]